MHRSGLRGVSGFADFRSVRKRGCIEVGRLQNSDWNKDFQKNESDTSKKLPNTNVI